MAVHVVRPAQAVSAHHRPGGGFQNPWGPASQQSRFSELLKWALLERPRSRSRQTPDRATFAAAHRPLAPSFLPREKPEAIAVTWIGHSSFLVQIGGQNLLLDPVWGERASPLSWLGPRRWTPPGIPFDALPPIDGVVLSHDHYDHLDLPTVRRLVSRYPKAAWRVPMDASGHPVRRAAADRRGGPLARSLRPPGPSDGPAVGEPVSQGRVAGAH